MTTVADSTLLLVLSWLVVLTAFAVFGWRALLYTRITLRARGLRGPESWSKVGVVPRLKSVALYAFGQRRLFDEQPIGVAHATTHWAFFLFMVITIVESLERLIPSLDLAVIKDNAYFATTVDLFAGLVLVALAFAAFRRIVIKPDRLVLSLDATICLTLIGTLMASFLLAEAFLAVEDAAIGGWARPVGMALARAIQGAGIGPGAAGVVHDVMVYLHVGLVFVFMAYLGFSKHFHLVSASFNIFFGYRTRRGELPGESGEADSEPGVASLSDLYGYQVLNGLSCAECGRCDRSCPALTSGEPLAPRELMEGVKHQIYATAAGMMMPGSNGGSTNGSSSDLTGVITPEMLWACRTCGACVEKCPVRNNHVDLVVRMRRRLVFNGEMDAQLQATLENLGRYGNSFGQSPRRRARWNRDLEEKIKDASKEPVEYLWFVGDYASYDPGLQDITRATARVFQMAGLDFGTLGAAERTAGNDARRVGEEGLFEELVSQNAEALNGAEFKRIVTTDPHTLNALINEYPAFGHKWEVVHHTQVLAKLLRDGRLAPRPLNYSVAYHDPCYLARYNGIHREPREVLKALGVNLIEMERSRENTYCCGAGGGYIWMEDKPAEERPAENRIREAVALGVDYLVTACPKDTVMFRDAIKTTDNEGKIEVKDLAELVEEACRADAPQKQETAAEPVG